MIDKLKFILDGSEVERYHTVRTLHVETNGHHSHGVALICYLLDPNASRELILAALVHDLAEFRLGDIPAPSKREYGIGEQVNEMEERMLKSVDLHFDLTLKERRTLKLADIFQGITFCLRQIQLGNSAMRVVLGRYTSYAEGLILIGPEKELFDSMMREF